MTSSSNNTPNIVVEADDSSVRVSEHRGILIISFPLHFTVHQAVTFRSCLERQFVHRSHIRRVVFDFASTELIDSSGLGSLITNLKHARAHAIPVVIWSAGAQVKFALSLAGLDSMLSFVEGTEAVNPAHPVNSRDRPAVTHPSVRSVPKRLLDIICALIGLSLLAVIFPVIALSIQLDNPGPIFFSQVRLGWMGRRFRIWKFRSMVVNAEALLHTVKNEASGAFFKNQNDPRITRVGRFLRRTSLDELPQFWNVLIGDMSLIGTRPPTPDEVDRYAVPNWQRLDVRPGLSGEWQVNGRSRIRDFEDVIRLDLRYQENWSLGYDLRLILRTLQVIFSSRSGAS